MHSLETPLARARSENREPVQVESRAFGSLPPHLRGRGCRGWPQAGLLTLLHAGRQTRTLCGATRHAVSTRRVSGAGYDIEGSRTHGRSDAEASKLQSSINSTVVSTFTWSDASQPSNQPISTTYSTLTLELLGSAGGARSARPAGAARGRPATCASITAGILETTAETAAMASFVGVVPGRDA